MAKIDEWNDDRVDYAISLLVMAEHAVQAIDSDLWEKIHRFLNEEA